MIFLLWWNSPTVKVTHASESMSTGHRRSVGSMLWLTLANGIYNPPLLYDNDGKLCKEIARAVRHSSGKCTWTQLWLNIKTGVLCTMRSINSLCPNACLGSWVVLQLLPFRSALLAVTLVDDTVLSVSWNQTSLAFTQEEALVFAVSLIKPVD